MSRSSWVAYGLGWVGRVLLGSSISLSVLADGHLVVAGGHQFERMIPARGLLIGDTVVEQVVFSVVPWIDVTRPSEYYRRLDADPMLAMTMSRVTASIPVPSAFVRSVSGFALEAEGLFSLSHNYALIHVAGETYIARHTDRSKAALPPLDDARLTPVEARRVREVPVTGY